MGQGDMHRHIIQAETKVLKQSIRAKRVGHSDQTHAQTHCEMVNHNLKSVEITTHQKMNFHDTVFLL